MGSIPLPTGGREGRMKGCENCPAYAKCTVTYRGSACAALRGTYGIDDDPEIKTNADCIRAMSDERMAADLLPLLSHILEDGVPCEELLLDWLQRPAEEK